jgi:hypothetical protein
MASELPAESAGMPVEAADGHLDEIVAEGDDLDVELGEDIALDDEESSV